MDGFLAHLFGKDWAMNGLTLGAFILFLLIVRMLWKIQKVANGIKLEKLILEDNGDPSWTKMSGIGAWFVATFVVVHSELRGEVAQGMILLLLVYAGIYTLNRTAVWALSKFWPGGGTTTPPDVQQEIKVSAPASASVNVSTGDTPK